MTIQAIFFDMGGTIETFWYDQELRLQATPQIQWLLSRGGIDLGLSNTELCQVVSEGLERYHRWSLSSQQELPTFRVWSEYIFTDYSLDLEKLRSISEDLMFWVETRYYCREMRPEIPEVLERIRQMGLKIGLISNVCSYGQVPRNLEQYGIRQYFTPIVLSSEYGRRKPDPAIFHYAARLANVPTSCSAYVGDRVTRDIDGSRRAGFGLSVQIRNDFRSEDDGQGATPDAYIENMMELVEILQAKNRKSVALEASRTRQIRALLFDAGDILYHRPSKGKRFQKYLQDRGKDPSAIASGVRKQLQKKTYEGVLEMDEYRRSLLLMHGITEQEDILDGMQAIDADEQDVSFIEGVRETLCILKNQGFLLGIITDTAQPIWVKLNWFERGGFGDVWDSIISSCELGVCKPDARIYQAALDQLGVKPSQAAFIGHNAVELNGARAAGITTVAFNYETAAQADYYLKGFPDLLELPIIQIERRQVSI